MEPVNEHPWNLDVEEALLLQQKLATCVIQEDSLQKIETVAGVDVAYHPVSDALIAAVVVLDAVTLHPSNRSGWRIRYISLISPACFHSGSFHPSSKP